MATDSRARSFVPKVHPLERESTPEDPFELMAMPAVGDPEVMLECILQEFVWMGWSEAQLLALFHNPGYPVLCELREFYGAEEIQRRVAAWMAQTGQLHFREIIAEEGDDGVAEPELVQITHFCGREGEPRQQ